MTCQNFEAIVTDLVRQQIMEANIREQALAHSGECAACALKLEEEHMLTFGLGALATEMKSVQAPYRVEEQLRAAFRSRRFSHHVSSSTKRWGYLATAAAAVLLIVFGIVAMRLGLQSPSHNGPQANESVKTETPREETPRQEVAPVAGDSAVVPMPKQITLPSRPGRNASGHRAATSSSKRNDRSLAAREAKTTNDTQSEVATQFMPLGYVSPLNLQDGGLVVRVELPRSAMVNLGLPVNMDRYGERVKADVLMGSDGLARAIRFVQ